MDKHKEYGILLEPRNVVEYESKEVDMLEKESEMYNTVYKELHDIVGLDATLKIYLRFKGQQITFPVRLYNSHMIQQNVIREFDGTNVRELAKKYDYSEKTIRRMIRDSVEEVEDASEESIDDAE